MEKLSEYIEINFKLAYKSVTFHFKQFIWFYIAIFIVQAFLGIAVISSDINQKNIENSVSEKYDSHYVFYYMNTNQRYYLQKAANYVFDNDYIFDIVRVKEYGSEKDRDYKCDVYVKFSVDPEEGMATFNRKYAAGLEELGDVKSNPTPLFDLEDNIENTKNTYNLYVLIVSAFSFVLLAILYNIRSNNYRFDYGIYMAFGADKKKLLNTCFWEMTVIAILTFIPAVIVASLLNYALAVAEEIEFVLKLFSCLKILLLTFVINCLSVFFTIVKTAIKSPISLILSQDNSNLVFSPRRSVDILKSKKLGKLNNLSMLRYSKYYIVMILSGVLLSSVFVCGVYCSQLYTDKQNEHKPQFEVTFGEGLEYTAEDRAYFENFKGITGTYKECGTLAMGLSEHILVNRDNTLPSAMRVAYDDEMIAMDNVCYYAADEEVVAYLKSADFSGDLESVFTNDKTVIINESFNNTTHFKFKPGDKIKIADYYTTTSSVDFYLTGLDLLRERLRCCVFWYEEYTVGAVIHNDCSDENLKIYMNCDTYTEITETEPQFKKVYLYADESLDNKAADRLYSGILKMNEAAYRDGKGNVNVFVKNLYTNIDKELEKGTAFASKLIIISVLILLVSSLIWFFSQTLFYGRRQNEFTVLRSIGFKMKEVRSIFLKEALAVSVLSLLVYLGLSALMCFAVFKLMNSWIFFYEFRYMFEIPVSALIVGGITTIIFSFVSTVITYVTYKRNTKDSVPGR